MKQYKLFFPTRAAFLAATEHLRDEDGNWTAQVEAVNELGSIEIGTTDEGEPIKSDHYHVDMLANDDSLQQYIDPAIATATGYFHVFEDCEYPIAMPL